MHTNIDLDYTDPFLLLGFKHQFYLAPNKIDEAFRKAAAYHHPDHTTGSTKAFQALQLAVMTLRDPAKRLRYLAGIEESSSMPLPSTALSLFSPVINQLQESDMLIKKYHMAQSALLKATMVHQIVKVLHQLQELLFLIQQWYRSLEEHLQLLDATHSKATPHELLEQANSFNVAQRWEQQLRERKIALEVLL